MLPRSEKLRFLPDSLRRRLLWDPASPLLASLCARAGALSGSFEEAKDQLARHGIDLGIKTLRTIAYRFAQRAREMLRRVRYRLRQCNSVKGPKVVIGIDGGRARIRKDNGKKTKNRRNDGERGCVVPSCGGIPAWHGDPGSVSRSVYGRRSGSGIASRVW